MKYKLVIIALGVGLMVSLILNVYFYTSTPEKEPIYMADVELADYDWSEYSQNTENNLYFVEVGITLVNYGNSSAFVEIAYSMCDLDGNTIQEFYKTGESQGILSYVLYSTGYIIHPERTNHYGFSFSYQKPKDTQTYLKAEIVGVYQIP